MSNDTPRSGNGQSAPDAATDPDQSEDEQRMRRALGLGALRTGGGSAGRSSTAPVVVHRNGRGSGGEAPVNRIAEAQTALARERLAREQAEAALRAAELALKESETRRGHAELTRDEAVAALAVEREARQAAEEQLGLLAEAPTPESAAEPALLPRRRGRPPKSAKPATEPSDNSPVEWWVPGWKSRLARAR